MRSFHFSPPRFITIIHFLYAAFTFPLLLVHIYIYPLHVITVNDVFISFLSTESAVGTTASSSFFFFFTVWRSIDENCVIVNLSYRVGPQDLQVRFSGLQQLGHHVQETLHEGFDALRVAGHQQLVQSLHGYHHVPAHSDERGVNDTVF